MVPQGTGLSQPSRPARRARLARVGGGGGGGGGGEVALPGGREGLGRRPPLGDTEVCFNILNLCQRLVDREEAVVGRVG